MRGLYRYRAADGSARTARRSSRAARGAAGARAQQLLAEHHDVAADVWSVTGWKLLRDDALDCERWNRLHPTDAPRTPYVTEQLGAAEGPVVAVTDCMKTVPDQIARFVPQPFVVLGTDGYGFSDTRAALRRHFEVDAAHIVGRGARRARPDRRREGRGRRRGHRSATGSTPTADPRLA